MAKCCSGTPDNEKKVLEAIKKAGKPVKAGDVAEMTGIDKDEINKIITKLKKPAKSNRRNDACMS